VWVRGVVGLVFSLVGIVWILQGTNVVHGSGMSGHGGYAVLGVVVVLIGHGGYAVLGVVVVLIGVALLTWAWRIRGRQTS